MTKTIVRSVDARTIVPGTIIVGPMDIRRKAWRVAHIGGKVEITYSYGVTQSFAPSESVFIERH